MQESRDSGVIGPAKPQPAPERIPTTDELIYGETIYLKVGGKEERWLSGGRGDGNVEVVTLDGENGEAEKTYRWTVMKDRGTLGSGPVRYGDTIALKVGGDKERWLSGGRGNEQRQVLTRDGEGGKVEDSYRWTVMQSRETVGSGSVKRGSAVYLKVGGDKARWLSGGRGESQYQAVTLDGEGGKVEPSYQWTAFPVSYSRAFAIFAEDSPKTKYMQAGMNTRVFTRVEARSPDNAIQLDLKTGIITVPPGTYHITGFSATAYETGKEPPEMVTTGAPFANGGYCRLRRAGGTPEDIPNEEAIVVGSISTANVIPSLIETFFTTTVNAQLLMEHQSGSSVENVVLRANPNNSTWHIFARICITRL